MQNTVHSIIQNCKLASAVYRITLKGGRSCCKLGKIYIYPNRRAGGVTHSLATTLFPRGFRGQIFCDDATVIPPSLFPSSLDGKK
jgi:hypothetical protein